MDYPQTIQTAIVEKLAPLVSQGVSVAGVADRSDPAARHTKRLMVAYVGSDYSPPKQGMGPLVQSRKLRFELALQLQNQRTFEAAYPLLGEISNLLGGFRPVPGLLARLYLTSEEIAEVREQVQTWVIGLAIDIPHKS